MTNENRMTIDLSEGKGPIEIGEALHTWMLSRGRTLRYQFGETNARVSVSRAAYDFMYEYRRVSEPHAVYFPHRALRVYDWPITILYDTYEVFVEFVL